MITLYSEEAKKLCRLWFEKAQPDTPIDDYYTECDFVDIMCQHLIEPFRKEFIETVITFGIEDDRVAQLQHLYNMYKLVEEEITQALMRFYIITFEENHLPFLAKIKILDARGNVACLIDEDNL